MIAQQVIFGYRDGHRRLGGSVELDKLAAGALLGATDANVGSRTTRLITALPLPSVGLYALCGTWPAPEGGRPGAVWAHSLLIPLGGLGEVNELEAVASALRRPSPNTLADFAQPFELEAGSRSPLRSSDPDVLAELLAAATDPDAVPVVEVSDLSRGEAALFALWDSAWPALRATLSFRTRERVKAAPQLGYLCVARRVTGMWRPHAADARSNAVNLSQSRWVHELATRPLRSEKRDLRAFLWAFGPEGASQLAQLVSLGQLRELVQSGQTHRVAHLLASEHPKSTDAPVLKRALFGREHGAWWDAPELDLIEAIFGVGGRGFDLKSLELRPRVRKLVAAGRAIELIDARPRRGSKQLTSILVDALVKEATPSLLCDVLTADAALAEDVVRARPELLENEETWSIATDEQAAALAAAAELSDRAVASAVLAGRFSAVKPIVPLSTVALRLARARQLKALRKLFDDQESAEVLAGDHADELRIQLAAAGVGTGSFTELLYALEARRDQVDEVWLRAAVYALGTAGKKRQRTALEVVFGPLHHAITDDRFPHELWGELGKVTPPADDPALRLRRLLVVRARDEEWPSEALERALRGSGPYVKELKAELGDDDDPFVAVAKAALKAWKRFVG